jgi:hypothetical protein
MLVALLLGCLSSMLTHVTDGTVSGRMVTALTSMLPYHGGHNHARRAGTCPSSMQHTEPESMLSTMEHPQGVKHAGTSRRSSVLRQGLGLLCTALVLHKLRPSTEHTP